jgi:DNA-binding transcriptional ArsR family regulator
MHNYYAIMSSSGKPRQARIDTAALRVLAHPLRTRLLSRLRLEGPATATVLAQALDTNTGATSYHLRRLADVGLVEEVHERSGRERWWRAAHEMHSFSASDFAGDPDSEAALEWLQGEYFRLFQRHAEEWAAEEAEWPLEWRDAAGASDYLLRLTPAALTAMQKEIHAVVESYRTADSDRVADPEARRVFFYVHSFPESKHGRTHR